MAAPSTKTLAKSLRLLRAFTPDRPALSAAELSRHAALPVSSVYRFLATFRQYGLIEVDPEQGRFRPGLGLLELATTVLNGLDVRRVAIRPLEELQAATSATAFLTVLREDRAVCVEKVESGEAIRVCQSVGESRPLYAGAPAKVLLAYLEPARLEAILAQPLARMTRKTTVDPAALRPQLVAIRARGYAISAGEFLPNARAVAVPVRDREGRVIASLAVAAPTNQLTPARAAGFVPLLQARAAEISAALGYRSGNGQVSGARPGVRVRARKGQAGGG